MFKMKPAAIREELKTHFMSQKYEFRMHGHRLIELINKDDAAGFLLEFGEHIEKVLSEEESYMFVQMNYLNQLYKR